MEQKYLEQVKAVFVYGGNDWYRVYLLRALNRLAGMDGVLAVMNSPLWAWAFPPEVIRLQVTGRSKTDFVFSWERDFLFSLERVFSITFRHYLSLSKDNRAILVGLNSVMLF